MQVQLTILLVVLGIGWQISLRYLKTRRTKLAARPSLDHLLAKAELEVLRTLEKKLAAKPDDPKLKTIRRRVMDLELQSGV